MSPQPLPLPIDLVGDPGVPRRLVEAIEGRGPLLLPHGPGQDPGLPSAHGEIDTSVLPPAGGLAVGTSGSTGASKRVVLPPEALAASADATHRRLGGPGQWLLALPPHHIAGLQILLRTLRAGHEIVRTPTGPFTADGFAYGVEGLSAGRRYTSLVPVQVARILEHPGATAAAASLDAVLVGGSRIDDRLLARAREAGIRLVTTYGMSETAGGCVYDGRPLDGVHLRIDQGRIHLAGAVLASGYLLRRTRNMDSPFVLHGGLRWFRTDDAGHLADDGRLLVDGRLDDVIISGGMKVWPTEVERTLLEIAPVGHDLAVVGVPDPTWGQRVAVVVECRDCTNTEPLIALLDHARERLPAHARPRLGRVVRSMPRLGPGKPDRARLTSLLMESEWDDGRSTVHEED